MFTLRIGIFTKTRERADYVFEKIVRKIGAEKIKYVKRDKYHGSNRCILLNGTTIDTIIASDSCRGRKFDKIFYDNDIDTETFNCIVRPCLLNPIWSFKQLGLDS